MQKVFNLFSTVAFLGVVAIGAGAGYVYVNKDAIVEGVKEAAMEQVTEALPGLIGGSLGGVAFPLVVAALLVPGLAAVYLFLVLL